MGTFCDKDPTWYNVKVTQTVAISEENKAKESGTFK